MGSSPSLVQLTIGREPYIGKSTHDVLSNICAKAHMTFSLTVAKCLAALALAYI